MTDARRPQRIAMTTTIAAINGSARSMGVVSGNNTCCYGTAACGVGSRANSASKPSIVSGVSVER